MNLNHIEFKAWPSDTFWGKKAQQFNWTPSAGLIV